VNAIDAELALDHPVWSCLSTRHAHLARGEGKARRYTEAVSPIGAVSGASAAHVAALEGLIEVGEDVALIGPAPVLGGNWETLYASRVTQMIRRDRSMLPEGDVETATLGGADVPEMLALVELTHPGPFRARTIELGRYLGIRRHGRLVAMAGERMWIGDHREVSAVCTHPDVQGRGYGRALVGRIVNGMLARGEIPILHVDNPNRRAIDMYRALGFTARTELALLHTRRRG